jgi:hypothetical protein
MTSALGRTMRTSACRATHQQLALAPRAKADAVARPEVA